MLWILMLLAVGICGAVGFYDRVIDFSDTMRYVNSGILVALSLGLLVRTWILTKIGRNERLQARIEELEKASGQGDRRAEGAQKETETRSYQQARR